MPLTSLSLDYLWALYESFDSKGLVVVMGDCTGDLGNALGDRGHYDPNVRGLKLIEFAKGPVKLIKRVKTAHSF